MERNFTFQQDSDLKHTSKSQQHTSPDRAESWSKANQQSAAWPEEGAVQELLSLTEWERQRKEGLFNRGV